MRFVFCLLLTVCGAAAAADLSRIEHPIVKEPKYTGKPQYCLLVFGAEAKHRVWLVQDSDALYVDRNGNGDLTEAGEKVTGKRSDSTDAFQFEAGALTIGGKLHKGLEVTVAPVKSLSSNPNLMALPHVAAAIKKNPDATTGRIVMDVECESLKGGGIGGRVSYMVTLFDTEGVLQLGSKPADAPIIHLDGPLQITFYANKPTWIGGRSQDTILCIGTRGHGPGTFAMIAYDNTVPAGIYPKIDATFQSKNQAVNPVKELFELKKRC